jgi:hypothetical protein
MADHRQALSRLTDPQLHEIARVMEAAARKAQREAAAAQSRAALARRELKRRRRERTAQDNPNG